MSLFPDRLDDEPVVGWRMWTLQIETYTLKAVNWPVYWEPGVRAVARCTSWTSREHELDEAAPAVECTCGFYAYASSEQAELELWKRIGKRVSYHPINQIPVIGQASFWGKVMDHERGWRGQYAYPYRILVPVDDAIDYYDHLKARKRLAAGYHVEVEEIRR